MNPYRHYMEKQALNAKKLYDLAKANNIVTTAGDWRYAARRLGRGHSMEDIGFLSKDQIGRIRQAAPRMDRLEYGGYINQEGQVATAQKGTPWSTIFYTPVEGQRKAVKSLNSPWPGIGLTTSPAAQKATHFYHTHPRRTIDATGALLDGREAPSWVRPDTAEDLKRTLAVPVYRQEYEVGAAHPSRPSSGDISTQIRVGHRGFNPHDLSTKSSILALRPDGQLEESVTLHNRAKMHEEGVKQMHRNIRSQSRVAREISDEKDRDWLLKNVADMKAEGLQGQFAKHHFTSGKNMRTIYRTIPEA